MQDEHNAATALRLVREWEEALEAQSGGEYERIQVPPFAALLAADDARDSLNVVVPVAAQGDVSGAIQQLRELFTSRGRELRVEFADRLWPTLAEQLQACGLTVDGRRPLMACWPERLQSVSAEGVSVRLMEADDPDELLAAFQAIRWSDEGGPASGTGAEDLRERLKAARGLYALASIDHRPAGTAVIHPLRGIAEMVGVATAEPARRRGVAATACSFLCRHHFEGGGRLVWLDAEGEPARRLYAGLGFDELGDWLELCDAPERTRTST